MSERLVDWGNITLVEPGSLALGVYETPDHQIYVVKSTRSKTRKYALRLVESPDRLNQKRERVRFDFQYESGAIYKLRPEYKMTTKRAKRYLVRYGRCLVCGRTIKAADSVYLGIGPVCIQYFR